MPAEIAPSAERVVAAARRTVVDGLAVLFLTTVHHVYGPTSTTPMAEPRGSRGRLRSGGSRGRVRGLHAQGGHSGRIPVRRVMAELSASAPTGIVRPRRPPPGHRSCPRLRGEGWSGRGEAATSRRLEWAPPTLKRRRRGAPHTRGARYRREVENAPQRLARHHRPRVVPRATLIDPGGAARARRISAGPRSRSRSW
jgi:hypothetical protein